MLKSKNFKKIISIILASVLCLFAMPQVLFAADDTDAYALKGTMSSLIELVGDDNITWSSGTLTGKINIQLQTGSDGNPSDGAIFTAYKLLDIEKDAQDMLKITVNPNAQAFWDKYTGVTNATIGDIKTRLGDFSDEAAKSKSIVDAVLANPTELAATQKTTSGPVTNDRTQITTDLGFYVVMQTGAPAKGYIASAPVLACLPMQENGTSNWLSTFTIKPKDDTVSITKKLKMLTTEKIIKTKQLQKSTIPLNMKLLQSSRHTVLTF